MSEERTEYNTGAPIQPKLTEVITQRISFADASQIVVIVKAPAGAADEAGEVLAADMATLAYYAHLLAALDRIKAIGKKGKGREEGRTHTQAGNGAGDGESD